MKPYLRGRTTAMPVQVFLPCLLFAFSLCFFLFGYPDPLHLLSTYSHAHKFTTSHTTPSVESAIHQNGLARNESRCIAQQEDQCPSELLRIAQTAECRIVNKPLRPIGIRPIGVREQCAVLFRKEYTGGNSIYPHFITIALCQFHGHPLGVSFNRTLRHIVTHNASNCLLCGQRRNVYDRPLSLFRDYPTENVRRDYRSKKVELHGFLRIGDLSVKKVLVRADCCAGDIPPGSIDQPVYRTPSIQNLVLSPMYGLFIQHIGDYSNSIAAIAFYCCNTFIGSFSVAPQNRYFCSGRCSC